MERKLYRVEVNYTLYVVAECAAEAQIEGEMSAKNEHADSVVASSVKSESEIDRKWRDCLPYNGGDKKTCLEVFKAQGPTTTELEAAGQVPLFGGSE